MPSVRTAVRFEPMEGRTLLSGPSPREQQMLELLNRLRTRPAQELPLLLASRDPDVIAALKFFRVDRARLAGQWANLTAVAPLAWNDALARSAGAHTQKMLGFDEQSHQLPGEAALLPRLTAAGYANPAFVGENVFAFMGSVQHAHAGFAIDWGTGPGGLQSPAGHRDNLMAGVFDEVGLAIVDGIPGKSTGPLLVTQDFGSRRAQRPFLLGAVYDDKNHDGAYSPGEGVAGETIVATGVMGTYVTTTQSAGGYQMQLPAGTYKVTASGGNLRGLATRTNVAIGVDNVKRDFTRGDFAVDAAGPGGRVTAAGRPNPGGTTATFDVAFTDDAAVNAATLSNGDVRVSGPGGFSAVAQLVSVDRPLQNGPLRSAKYRFTAPGGFFDSTDNGVYRLTVEAGQVSDINGNAAPARAVGTFAVNVPPVVLAPDGGLVVNGTAGGDAIYVSAVRGVITANVNGTRFGFNASAVRKVCLNGLAGDDVLTVGPGVAACALIGGAGDDTITGSGGADTIVGAAGDDLMIGGGGRDHVDGGLGVDRAKGDRRDRFSGVELLFA